MSRIGTWLATPWNANADIAWNLPAIAVFVAAILGAAVIGASPLRSELLQPDERTTVTPRTLTAIAPELPAERDSMEWKARETAVHIAEQRGRFAWITASLILLVVCVVTVIVSTWTLIGTLLTSRRLWSFVAVISILSTFAVLDGLSGKNLGDASWSLDEVPAVLEGLGYPPSEAAPSTRWQGMITGIGLPPQAWPTTWAGTPSSFAISP